MRMGYIGVVVLLAGCSRVDDRSADQVGTTTVTSVSLPTERDQPLIRRVEAAIAADPAMSIAARNVEVDAVDGAVVLYGSVSSFATKQAIADVVERAIGRSLLDKVAVAAARPGDEAAADDTVSFKLQRALLNDPASSRDADAVTIDVTKGMVTLRGAASSPAAREAVEALAYKTPGVVSVTNDLTVRR